MIYMIRHALDDEAYVGSWSNVPILKEEEKRVREQARYIKDNLKVSGIITSDIRRAKDTARIIGEELHLPIIEDPNLREQNKGTLTGKLRTSLTEEERFLLKNQQIDTIFPEGESLLQVYERIKKYLEKIKQYQDHSLVVSHRGVINMIYYYLRDIPLDMDKKKFQVDHLSIHEVDIEKKLIRRIK